MQAAIVWRSGRRVEPVLQGPQDAVAPRRQKPAVSAPASAPQPHRSGVEGCQTAAWVKFGGVESERVGECAFFRDDLISEQSWHLHLVRDPTSESVSVPIPLSDSHPLPAGRLQSIQASPPTSSAPPSPLNCFGQHISTFSEPI
jgi:hypothetical protein